MPLSKQAEYKTLLEPLPISILYPLFCAGFLHICSEKQRDFFDRTDIVEPLPAQATTEKLGRKSTLRVRFEPTIEEFK
jgi:hypothetical protein